MRFLAHTLFIQFFIFPFIFVSPQALTSVTDLRQTCCLCEKYSLNCPFCTYRLSSNACGTASNAGSTWANAVNSISSLMTVSTSTLRPQNTEVYIRSWSASIFTNYYESTCLKSPTTIQAQGSEWISSAQCVARGSNCPLSDECFYLETYEDVCYSRCDKYAYTTYAGATNTFVCSESGYRMNAPKLAEYLLALSKCQPVLSISIQGDNLITRVPDTTNLDSFIRRNKQRAMIPLSRRLDSSVNVFCTNDPTFAAFANGENHFWWSNVLVIMRVGCSFYLPFSDEIDVCVDDLFFDTYAFACPFSTRPATKYLTAVDITTYLPSPDTSGSNSTGGCCNTTCEQLNDRFACSYKHWIDYYINASAQAGPADFDYEDYLKKQDQYASDRAQQSRSSWWDWLTAPGIALFWHYGEAAFINVIEPFFIALIEAISDIVIEILNTFIAIFKNSQQYIDRLIDIITQLLDVLFSLVALILKVFLGVLIRFEQHFMLFEYTVLFLLINSKILNNNIFSLIIVVLLMVVFGIDRHSPSVLLAFYNIQYSYVNFTGYDMERFDFAYTLTYHNPITGSNYTLTLLPPNMDVSTIGRYELNPSEPITFDPYPVETKPITCSQFNRFPIN